MKNKQQYSLLENIKTAIKEEVKQAFSAHNKRWLRTHQAAEYLSISESQLHHLKSHGVISCRKISGTNYYDREEIDRLLEEAGNSQTS